MQSTSSQSDNDTVEEYAVEAAVNSGKVKNSNPFASIFDISMHAEFSTTTKYFLNDIICSWNQGDRREMRSHNEHGEYFNYLWCTQQ